MQICTIFIKTTWDESFSQAASSDNVFAVVGM